MQTSAVGKVANLGSQQGPGRQVVHICPGKAAGEAQNIVVAAEM